MQSITGLRAENLAIGQLSRLSGVNIETVRYYERIKMLPPPPRTASGRRVYDSTHVRTLAFIRRSRELGFSLEEIRALMRLGGPEKATCRDVRAIAAHRPRSWALAATRDPDTVPATASPAALPSTPLPASRRQPAAGTVHPRTRRLLTRRTRSLPPLLLLLRLLADKNQQHRFRKMSRLHSGLQA